MRILYSAFVLLYLLVAVAASGGSRVAQAQAFSDSWTAPQLITATEGLLADSNMTLLADRAGNLHLFYPHLPGGTNTYSIDYVRWDGSQWSEPVDVLLDPNGSPSFLRAVIDSQNIVHLLWHGGMSSLRYAQAPLALAHDARTWSPPVAIASVFGEPDLLVARDGALYVGFSNGDGPGTVSILRSSDGGVSWTPPTTVYYSRPEEAPDEIRLAEDESGRLHIVWTEYKLPQGWPPVAAYYSQSTDRGETWMTPTQIAEVSHGQIGVAAVGANDIHLVWRSTIGGDGTFHQWSGDGGLTWQRADQYDDKGGFSGLPSFAVDSLGNLHYAIGPAKSASWQDGQLSAYSIVYGNLEHMMQLHDAIDRQLDRGMTWVEHPERSQIALTTGNQLHVVFETGFNTLWHVSRILAAPALPTQALALPEAARPTALPIPTATLTPHARAASVVETSLPPLDAPPEQTGTVLQFAIIPACLLVVGVAAAHIVLQRGR